jgi:hypothetical protein
MAALNKVCPICGNKYNHCVKCERIGSWRALACSHKCYQVYMVIAEIREGILTEKEAATELENIGVTDEYAKGNFITSVAEVVEHILTKKVATEVTKTNKKSK